MDHKKSSSFPSRFENCFPPPSHSSLQHCTLLHFCDNQDKNYGALKHQASYSFSVSPCLRDYSVHIHQTVPMMKEKTLFP